MSQLRKVCLTLLIGLAPTEAALADCYTDHSSCTTACAATMVGSAIIAGKTGGNYDANAPIACTNSCDSTRDACLAREAQLELVKQQQAQAVEAQNRARANDAARADDSRRVQEARTVAAQISAENASRAQVDDTIAKGMDGLDRKAFITAEYQFRLALKNRPSDPDARKGLILALLGQNKRPAAYAFANDELLASISRPMPPRERSSYRTLVDDLESEGLLSTQEAAGLRSFQPLGATSPAAADAFVSANPKSPVLPFVQRLSEVLPAVLADAEDRARVQARVDAEAKAAQVPLSMAGYARVDQMLGPSARSAIETNPVFRRGRVERSFSLQVERETVVSTSPARCQFADLGKKYGLINVVSVTNARENGSLRPPVLYSNTEQSDNQCYDIKEGEHRSKTRIVSIRPTEFAAGSVSETANAELCKKGKCAPEPDRASQYQSRLDSVALDKHWRDVRPGEALNGRIASSFSTGAQTSAFSTDYKCRLERESPADEAGVPIAGSIRVFSCTTQSQYSGQAQAPATMEIYYSDYLGSTLSFIGLPAVRQTGYSTTIKSMSGQLRAPGDTLTIEVDTQAESFRGYARYTLTQDAQQIQSTEP